MTQCNKRSCPNSRYEIEKIESIPLDLIIEILTRLPAKSLARFRCVSKLWKSTACIPNFEESFFTISSSRPKTLFACLKDGKTIFFTSPQAPLTANQHMSFSVNCPSGFCRPVRGLVCCTNQETKDGGKRVTVPLICNPSTGKYVTLPKVKTTRKTLIHYLGYDPIEKQFKVLFMSKHFFDPTSKSEEHQVLTLGTEKKPSWRKINCDIPHTPNVWIRQYGVYAGVYDGICINGVLYYVAQINGGDKVIDIVCFDIKSEKFSRLKKAQGMEIVLNYGKKLGPTLVNHNGKLAMIQPDIVSGTCAGIQLWVLEDAKKHEWSNYSYVWPPWWEYVFKYTNELRFVGMTSTSEIVFSVDCITDPFLLLYYNTERNTITSVGIKGMEAFKTCKVFTFLDHVEDLRLVTSV